jgi:hypothetical protein
VPLADRLVKGMARFAARGPQGCRKVVVGCEGPQGGEGSLGETPPRTVAADDGGRTLRLPCRGLWVALICGVFAACIVLGTHTGMHQSDSLVPILASLYRWTPFYWQENRFGMLVAALAIPVRDPWLNLLFQNWLTAGCGLGLFFALARLLAEKDEWVVAGLAALALFFALTSDDYRFWTLSTCQPYTPSLLLVIGGVVVWPRTGDLARHRRRLAIAGAMLVAASWVNTAAPVFALLLWAPPYTLKRIVDIPRRRDRSTKLSEIWSRARADLELWLGGALGLALVAGWLMVKLAPYPRTRLSALPIAQWPEGFLSLWANTFSELRVSTSLVLVVGVAALATAVAVFRTEAVERRVLLTQMARVLVAAIVYVAFAGSLMWTKLNDHAFRYAIPSVILLCTGSAWLLARVGWCRLQRTARRLTIVLLVVAVAVVVVGDYGVPSSQGARLALDQAIGRDTSDVLKARCTHLIGNYWNVWAGMYHAALVASDRGDTTHPWGLSFRSRPTEPLWRAEASSNWRVCAVPNDADVDRYWQAYDLPPSVEVQRVGNIDVFTLR